MKMEQRNALLNVPSYILDYLKTKETSDLSLEGLNYESNSVNTYFWLSTIDHYSYKLFKINFKNL